MAVAEAKAVVIAYVPELDDKSDVSEPRERRRVHPKTERPLRSFEEVEAERLKREVVRRGARERARGKTLPGIHRRPTAGADATINDDRDDDDLTVASSVGVGRLERFTSVLTKTRDAVFHRDPPVLEIFTYDGHEQVKEVQGPVAWNNFEETRPPPSWRQAADKFFRSGIIGAKRDDPAVFYDEEAQREDAHRRRLKGMSSKERRLSRLSTTAFVPPPVQPVYPQHDLSFLRAGCLAKATARHVPSIFAEHPLEEFKRFGGRTRPLVSPRVEAEEDVWEEEKGEERPEEKEGEKGFEEKEGKEVVGAWTLLDDVH